MQVQFAVDAGLPSTYILLSSPLRGTGQSQTFRELLLQQHVCNVPIRILMIYPSELASTFFIIIIHHHHRRSNVNRDTCKNNKVLFKGREKTKQKSHIDKIILARESTESKQASKLHINKHYDLPEIDR